MNDVLAWGMDGIRAVQSVANTGFTVFFSLLTVTGSAPFIVSAILIAYWCLDTRTGFRFTVVLLVSAFFNGRIKEAMMVERPFVQDPSLLITSKASWVPDWVLGIDRFSFPSGHAQTSATVWAFIASVIRKPYAVALAVLIPLFVGLSRIYLGVHYPSDVLAGLLLGYCIVAVYLFFADSLTRWGRRFPTRILLAAAALVALLMNFLAMQLAVRVVETTTELFKADVSIAAGLFGFVSGYIVMKKRVRFSAAGTVMNKIIRVVSGGCVAASIFAGIGFLLNLSGGDFALAGSFLKYAFTGFWVSCGAPWFFVKINIAGTFPQIEEPSDQLQDLK